MLSSHCTSLTLFCDRTTSMSASEKLREVYDLPRRLEDVPDGRIEIDHVCNSGYECLERVGHKLTEYLPGMRNSPS